jgi:hypothetical protein
LSGGRRNRVSNGRKRFAKFHGVVLARLPDAFRRWLVPPHRLVAERFGLPRIEDDRAFARFAKHVVAVDQ